VIRRRPLAIALFISVATSFLLVVFYAVLGIVLGGIGAVMALVSRTPKAEHRAWTILSIAVGVIIPPAAYVVLLVLAG